MRASKLRFARSARISKRSEIRSTTRFPRTHENRFRHISELVRLGASIKVEGRVCVVEGVKTLSGAKLRAAELRGGADIKKV